MKSNLLDFPNKCPRDCGSSLLASSETKRLMAALCAAINLLLLLLLLDGLKLAKALWKIKEFSNYD